MVNMIVLLVDLIFTTHFMDITDLTAIFSVNIKNLITLRSHVSMCETQMSHCLNFNTVLLTSKKNKKNNCNLRAVYIRMLTGKSTP